MDRERMTRELRDPRHVRWVRVDALLAREELACIDGRHQTHTFAAPGGNAGELLLLLTVLERRIGRELGAEDSKRALSAYIDRFGLFYLHTDAHAVGRLAQRLAMDPKALREQLGAPGPELAETLLQELVKPEHVGCGHLAQMLVEPDAYRVRRGLTEGLMRAFFELHFAGVPDTDFVVLEGDHEEQALIQFCSRTQVEGETLVPRYRSLPGGPSVFVNHLSALRFVRRKGMELLLEPGVLAGSEQLDLSQLLSDVEALAGDHLDTTISRLAPGLPRYQVLFHDQSVELMP